MKTSTLARWALFTALMCLCAWISINVGDVAFTLQTFALFLALLLLGGKGAAAVTLVYLLLGCAGLPVFSGFRGGLGALLGATGGYILSFPVACLVYRAAARLLPGKAVLCLSLAQLSCYILGTAWFMAVYLPSGSHLGLGAVLLRCVAPYLLPDAAKLALAVLLARRLKPYLSA